MAVGTIAASSAMRNIKPTDCRLILK